MRLTKAAGAGRTGIGITRLVLGDDEPGEVDGDTTGFVVADGHGNVLSVIQSLYKGFGSGVVVPGTGISLQNRGAGFSVKPGAANEIAGHGTFAAFGGR